MKPRGSLPLSQKGLIFPYPFRLIETYLFKIPFSISSHTLVSQAVSYIQAFCLQFLTQYPSLSGVLHILQK
jgi:hypothetical protein